LKDTPLVVRVIGLGGAGVNAAAHMAQSDLRELKPAAVHTSARILERIEGPEKVLLGSN